MNDDERFVKTYKQTGKGLSDTVTEIWVDTQTGVNYIFHKSGYGAGLTPLLDKGGKPIVTLNEIK